MDDSLSDIAAEFQNELLEGENSVPGTSAEKTSEKPKVSSKTHCLLVNPKQRGNPLLKSVRNVPWEYDDIVPDYQMGQTTCALFLSLRYHNLNPDYIHNRLKPLGHMYQLRVLLVQVDIKDPHYVLKTLTRICILADLTLILAWSPEEAGKIIETYKIYENKPADTIRERNESSPYLNLIQALTTIKPINKTDAMTLLNRFKTLEGVVKASEYQLSECPGIGPRKAKKLYSVLHEKFCK
ncbi:DNA excision repair protein ERCC-1 [Anoplophora glabripennis]|uniref:DNA excision repair protein ERCC-1 n=1 Tax=Anoplophora glabripennis TaxID=217634 RepID=UPI000874AD08|nr:DNA excision repair protein ERCC-1 [Anoplophora glabripennis]